MIRLGAKPYATRDCECDQPEHDHVGVAISPTKRPPCLGVLVELRYVNVISAQHYIGTRSRTRSRSLWRPCLSAAENNVRLDGSNASAPVIAVQTGGASPNRAHAFAIGRRFPGVRVRAVHAEALAHHDPRFTSQMEVGQRSKVGARIASLARAKPLL